MLRRVSIFLVCVVAVLVIWTVLSWPLPRYFASGVPSSAHGTEKGHVRTMVAGDHLQILYQFWLFGDMVTGQTPFFHNLYEFNVGDDAARVENSSYFFPFPLFYLLGAWISRACGWNIGLIVSLLLTYFFTLSLVRRYTDSAGPAYVLSLFAVMFPFRWITMLGGSPTGLAMMWVPLLLFGLDVAVRDEKVWGGAVAGACLLVSFLSDTHVFFFCAAAMPFWCIFAFLARARFEWKKISSYLHLAKALWPTVVFALVTLWLVKMVRSDVEGSAMAAGRSVAEVALFCPQPAGLFMWGTTGPTSHIYLGWVPIMLILAGWLMGFVRLRENPHLSMQNWMLLTLSCLSLTGMAILALGPHGPFGGRLFMLTRRLVPPYEMVRQTGKIFCLVPTIMGVAAALAANSLRLGERRWSGPILAVLFVLALGESRAQFHPDVCLLQEKQGAYEAVAKDAEAGKEVPRALAVTLWPGDTHWSSLYEHFASLYRIRMVNGYQPVVPVSYVEDIFSRFDSVNMGELREDQLDELLRRGIQYVLLHEDAFPEKVSSYPVGFTLKKLQENPRLELLEQDKRVWAFKILEHSREKSGLGPSLFFSPSRKWEFERTHGQLRNIMADSGVSGGAYVSLSEEDAYLHSRATATVQIQKQQWLIRVRGEGTLTCEVFVEDAPWDSFPLDIRSEEWIWEAVSIPKLDSYSTVSLKLHRSSGSIDLDLILLTSGSWPEMSVGSELALSPQAFFHAGYSKGDSVVLEADSDPDDPIFYGPMMPFEAGEYEMIFDYESGAPAGTKLGELRLQNGFEGKGPFEVVVGKEARASFDLNANLPLRMDFDFSRSGNIVIRQVTFRRLK